MVIGLDTKDIFIAIRYIAYIYIFVYVCSLTWPQMQPDLKAETQHNNRTISTFVTVRMNKLRNWPKNITFS